MSSFVRSIMQPRKVVLVSKLGYGNDGTVWRTNRQSAVKCFGRLDSFERERNCYQRLFNNDIETLVGFEVPRLLDYNNMRWIIHMTIVSPPCIIDFGKAYVDVAPDFSEEVLADAEDTERELFSDEEWKQVRLVRAALRNLGIYYYDARPSNIMFSTDS